MGSCTTSSAFSPGFSWRWIPSESMVKVWSASPPGFFSVNFRLAPGTVFTKVGAKAKSAIVNSTVTALPMPVRSETPLLFTGPSSATGIAGGVGDGVGEAVGLKLGIGGSLSTCPALRVQPAAAMTRTRASTSRRVTKGLSLNHLPGSREDHSQRAGTIQPGVPEIYIGRVRPLDRLTGGDRKIFAACAGLAAALCLAGLTSRSLWIDEAVALRIAQTPGWRVLMSDGGNMPAYYFLLRAWTALGDDL